MKRILKFMADEMAKTPADYHFMKNKKSKPTYPYFVGELLPTEPVNEDGLREYTFILTGFNRGEWSEFLTTIEKIEEHFPSVEGLTAMIGNQFIAVFNCGTQTLETEDEALQKTQTNLTIKTWKGGN